MATRPTKGIPAKTSEATREAAEETSVERIGDGFSDDTRTHAVSNGAVNLSAAGSSTSDTTGTATALHGEKPQQRGDLDIEYFRNLLLSERGRLEDERDTIRASGLDMDGALPEEGEGGDEDTADLASAMMDKEMDLAVEEELEDLMAAIDHALQKIDDGTYGVCDMSGQNIPRGRLELIPWASLTAECQAMAEGES